MYSTSSNASNRYFWSDGELAAANKQEQAQGNRSALLHGFVFFFRSAHHFRFASLRRFRAAALIRRRLRFPVV